MDKPGLPPQTSPASRLDTAHADDAGSPWLPTSHDIVQRVRRWSGQRRIGHTGTLDPMASGVLVLCLGATTRLVEYYQAHAKRYYAEIELGTATDTYDAMGTVLDRGHAPQLTPARVEEALARFRGTIQQRPPVYSALKQDGEAAHRRARRGEAVDLPARTVTFYGLELVDFPAPNRIAVRAHCSAGTYIRSLAYDLGVVLGTPAHLAVLRREAAGAFTLADAHPLDQVEAAAAGNDFSALLVPPGERLGLPVVRLNPEQTRAFGFGQKVELTESQSTERLWEDRESADGQTVDSALAQAYSLQGQFLGIIRRLSRSGTDGDNAEQPTVWKAEKWMATEDSNPEGDNSTSRRTGEMDTGKRDTGKVDAGKIEHKMTDGGTS